MKSNSAGNTFAILLVQFRIHTIHLYGQNKKNSGSGNNPNPKWNPNFKVTSAGSPPTPRSSHTPHPASGVGVRLKVGDKYWEEWRLGLGRDCAFPSWGSGGLPPEKKNQICAKNYAILSKFWYFFPILQHKNLSAHQRKWGIIHSPKSGGPIPLSPPAPTPMRILPK